MPGPQMTGVALLTSLISHVSQGPTSLDVAFVLANGASQLPGHWRAAFGTATYVRLGEAESSGPFDIVVLDVQAQVADADVLDCFRSLRPGGLLVLEEPGTVLAEKLSGLVDLLNRVCFDDDFVGPMPDIENEVKVALFLQGLVILAKHGVGDELDYLTNGDYGRAYGEGRGQIIARLRLWEAAARPTPKEAEHFKTYLDLYRLRLTRVTAVLTFNLKLADDGQKVIVKPRRKKRGREMSITEFKKALESDLHFGLAVHSQRIVVGSVQPLDAARAEVEIQFLPSMVVPPGDVDYRFHPKIAWRSWRSYFRSSKPHVLHATAQTFREKALMVGEDLSDLYQGSVTIGAIENKWRVLLHSPDCDQYSAAITLHKFSCSIDGESEQVDGPVEHSPLYQLFAKEKLDCCIGTGAWGGLFERKVQHSKGLNALVQDGELMLNGKTIAKFAGGATPGGSWKPSSKNSAKAEQALEKRARQLALAEDADCLRWTWDLLWGRLRPGGMYIFEQDGCYGGYGNPKKFKAPNSSVTGLARGWAGALAGGGRGKEIQLIAAHKNLIVVQKWNENAAVQRQEEL